MNSIQEAIKRDGYVLVKNMLSQQTIHDLRNDLSEYFHKGSTYSYLKGAKVVSNALNQFDLSDVAWILKNNQVTNLVSQIIGSNFLYVNHSSVSCNACVNWHRDCITESEYDIFHESHLEVDYSLYKVLIYLQDHGKDNAALTVRKGSHKSRNWKDCEVVDLNVNKGDVIIIDLRLLHRSYLNSKENSLLTQIYQKWYPHDECKEITTSMLVTEVLTKIISDRLYYKWLSSFIKQPNRRYIDRLLISYSFGLDNKFTQEHILKHVGNCTDDNSYISPAVISNLNQAGIRY